MVAPVALWMRPANHQTHVLRNSFVRRTKIREYITSANADPETSDLTGWNIRLCVACVMYCCLFLVWSGMPTAVAPGGNSLCWVHNGRSRFVWQCLPRAVPRGAGRQGSCQSRRREQSSRYEGANSNLPLYASTRPMEHHHSF